MQSSLNKSILADHVRRFPHWHSSPNLYLETATYRLSPVVPDLVIWNIGGLILPYKRQSSFKGISVDYGLKSVCGSERIPLKLSGRKYDLTNYQWKSSVFGYVPIDLGSDNLPNLLDRRGLWPTTPSWNVDFTFLLHHASDNQLNRSIAEWIGWI